jgi:hypothetical protein
MTSGDLNQGEVVFVSKEEADKVAKRMSQKHSEAFASYKLASGWAVGGVFLKKQRNIRFKSLDEIKDLWADLQCDHDDLGIDEYTDAVRAKSSSEISTQFGVDSIWILTNYSIKISGELGFKTVGKYLVLEITNGIETKTQKMGGAFEPYTPLMTRVAEELINKAVIWSTWNPRNNPTKWSSNSWFYMLQEDRSINEEQASEEVLFHQINPGARLRLISSNHKYH